MKIIFVTNDLTGLNGWSRYGLGIVNGAKKLGHDVLCLVETKIENTDIKQTTTLDRPLRYLANPYISIKTARRINRIIKDYKPDIIHFIVEPYATILPFLKKRKSKTIITIHGTYSYIPSLLDNKLKKIISFVFTHIVYRKISSIITISEFTKRHLLSKVNIPQLENKIITITNGVEIGKRPVRHANSQNIKSILFVGAVKSGKGLLEALQAVRYYRDNFSKNFIFNIVGSYKPNEQYFQKLQKYIHSNHLGQNIRFHGLVSEEKLELSYARADLFIMISLSKSNKWIEGYGLVYLEANKHGVPVIGSKISGASEAVIDGQTGYLADPYNFRDVAQKIDKILNSHSVNSQDCIAWARKNNVKEKTKTLIALYEKLCA